MEVGKLKYSALLAVAIILLCSIDVIKATPVRDTVFKAGKPLSDQEFKNAIEGKGVDLAEKIDFLPWKDQAPHLIGGDIVPSDAKNTILNESGKWVKAKVPYVISASFTQEQRQAIAYAMSIYHNKTCIRFVPRTAQKDYIKLIKSGSGCWSSVGKVGGGQEVSLDDACVSRTLPGTILHELMHALGFHHEHQRPDQKKYITVNYDNVAPGNRQWFDPMPKDQVNTLGLPYDYSSVMHYPKWAFGIDSSVDVIKAIRGNPLMGNSKDFTSTDLKKLNKLYCSTNSG